MVATPFFSILIPTKNRSTLVGDTIQSVLNQTLTDCEIIISDNDDTDATQRVVAAFDDPRIRYFRVHNLSMDENWDFARQQSRGDFVTFLPDKRVLRRISLEYLARALEKTQARVVSWQVDTIDDVEPDQLFFKKSRWSWNNDVQWHETHQLLDYSLHEYYRKSLLLLPRGLNSACHRSVLDTLLQSAATRLCYPVMPDYTMAFLQLAFVERLLHIPNALSLSRISVGNGRALKYQTDAALRKNFIAGFGGEALSYSHVPVKSLAAQNGIYNDFLRMRDLVGGNLAAHELPLEPYFINVYRDIVNSAIYGGDITEMLASWEIGLKQQPPEFQRAVRQAVRPVAMQYQSITLGYRISLRPAQRLYRRLRKGRHSPLFSKILDAVAWEEPFLNVTML